MMANDLLPAKAPDGLTRVEAQIAYRMVESLPRPLTLLEAAKAEGYRLKRARTYLADLRHSTSIARSSSRRGARTRPRATWQLQSKSETTTGMEARRSGP
jgi:hypothetical protein